MRIFVGNLASTTTAEDVQHLFVPYGLVNVTRLVQSRQTGRALGYCLVEMPQVTEAQAAVAGLQGVSIEGRLLSVHAAS